MKQFWSWDKGPPTPFLHSIIYSENCANGSDDCFTGSESSQYKLVFFYTQGFTALSARKVKTNFLCFYLDVLFVCFCSQVCCYLTQTNWNTLGVLFCFVFVCFVLFFVKCYSRLLGCSAFGQLSKHFYLMFLIIIGLSVTATCSSGCSGCFNQTSSKKTPFPRKPSQTLFQNGGC